PAQQGAARFAALRVFDLDDLGTEPGECLRAGWAGLELGQVQNTDAGKKGRKHAVCSHFLVLPSVASVAPDVDVVDVNRCLRHSVKSSDLHAQMTQLEIYQLRSKHERGCEPGRGSTFTTISFTGRVG